MGHQGANDIPFLDFSKLVAMNMEQEGSEEWKAMSRKVRDACESHGCFLLSYDKNRIPTKLRQQMLIAMKSLFDLPEETKMKYINPKPFASYSSDNFNPLVPRRQSFAIHEAQFIDASQALTYLMWPEGNPNFCDVLNSMSSNMQELFSMILKMIFESFGIGGKHSDSYVENHDSVLRVMKYKAPPSGDSNIPLGAHTDKTTLTILGHDEVQGLQILSKDGVWIPLMIPDGCFTVIIGDLLKAWGNGRLHAVSHRVLLSEEKERYIYGLFPNPKDGVNVEVPQELVDDDHPLRYRPFTYMDYLSYFIANRSEDALEIYAGV